MEIIKNWYAVYTKPRWEKKVAELLSERGMESYCPCTHAIHQWSDRKKKVKVPLITGYVFVRVDNSQLTYVKRVDGIINLVYWLGKPATIRDSEISQMKEFLDTHSQVQVQKIRVNLNDTVTINGTAFNDMNGKVVELHKNSAKVLMPSMGYMLVSYSNLNVESQQGYLRNRAI